MKKLETIVTLIQKPTEVEFTCPYCKSDVSEDFEEFLDISIHAPARGATYA